MKIELTKGFMAIIDDEDFEKIRSPKWHYQEKRHTGYAIRSIRKNGKNVTQRLHRLIMNAKPGEVVDHINGNGLDNRKSNLRIVGHKENCINRRSAGSTGLKGVTFNKREKVWIARIGERSNHRVIGRFASPEEAGRAYDREALKLYGEFAVTNFKKGA